MAVPEITTLPTAPSRQRPATFSDEADEFLSALPDFGDEANILAEFCETQAGNSATSANESANSAIESAGYADEASGYVTDAASYATIAAGSANYVGDWSTLTGALSIPASVYHNNTYWVLLTDLADVTTSEPSIDSTDWLQIHTKNVYPDIAPSLLLDFTTGLDQIVDFERDSIATYYDEKGQLQYAYENEPRITYDPDTQECKGLLIEESKTNLLTYSEDFSSAWGSSSSVKDVGYTAPDGNLTATKVTTTIANSNYLTQNIILSSNVSTVSVFVKAGNVSTLSLRYVGYDTSYSCKFDVYSGYVEHSYGCIETLNNGWYRCYITVEMVGTDLDGSIYLYLATDDGTSYSSTVGNYMYVWGAQLEEGSDPSSYIPTSSTTVTRAADVATVVTEVSGTLLENTDNIWQNTEQSPGTITLSNGNTKQVYHYPKTLTAAEITAISSN